MREALAAEAYQQALEAPPANIATETDEQRGATSHGLGNRTLAHTGAVRELSSRSSTDPALRFMWLEVTGKCQLACTHCYAESSPQGNHGDMRSEDWIRVIEQGADLGVDAVQFIGGEPTQHPDLVKLGRHALSYGMKVEVFSNLVSVKPEHWRLFETRGVSLATSYYSSDPAEHARITKGANAHKLTTANIAEAVKRGIQLRAGIIGIEGGQRTAQARQLLREIGVENIGYDDLRQVGRGVRDQEQSVEQLCGNCVTGVLAVSPSGEVWPCVFSRWLPVGNVRQQSLADVLASQAMAETRVALTEAFSKLGLSRAPHGKELQGSTPVRACSPNCSPSGSCSPNTSCSPDFSTCGPGYADSLEISQPDLSTASCEPPSFRACWPNCSPHCSPLCAPCAPCAPLAVHDQDGIVDARS